VGRAFRGVPQVRDRGGNAGQSFIEGGVPAVDQAAEGLRLHGPDRAGGRSRRRPGIPQLESRRSAARALTPDDIIDRLRTVKRQSCKLLIMPQLVRSTSPERNLRSLFSRSDSSL
jgi:hypothetical protein